MMPDRLANQVVTAACGRFHMFDQARELAAHGLLHTLFTDYPKSHPVRFGVPAERIETFLANGVVKQAMMRMPLANRLLPLTMRAIHAAFSKRMAARLPHDAKFFIGLSSFSLEALQLCRERGIPCAVDHGSLHQQTERSLVLEDARRWNVRPPMDLSPQWLIEKQQAEYDAANHIMVLSRAAERSMTEQGVPAGKLFCNPCGVDLGTFYPGSKSDDTFRVLQVGGISLRKGVLDLLEAFKLASLPNAELCFVGGGRFTSGLQGALERYQTLNVRFHEPVPQAHLRQAYQRSSVFVLASVADGFGMVVPQAMACGLPVIVTENVGASDLVEDGVNGFVVPIRSPGLIAQRLQQLHDDPDLARRMGQAAVRSVSAGFTWKDYGQRLADLLRQQRGMR
jgi:glycosyltransferase involved in cell wall biosynthesis